MSNDNKKENDKYLDKNKKANANPVNNDRPQINPADRSWESSGDPDSENDRKGRNVDIELENQDNEIEGREQQTTPKSKAKDIAEGFNKGK